MGKHDTLKDFAILVFVLLIGLGSALTLPWIVRAHIYAAQNGSHKLDNAPTATRYYVSKSGGGGNGKPWGNAFSDLQDALDKAENGDEIWVAAGIYKPGITVDLSFNLVSGVAMYGGFRGVETQRSQRDWEANPTILSGDINFFLLFTHSANSTHPVNLRWGYW